MSERDRGAAVERTKGRQRKARRGGMGEWVCARVETGRAQGRARQGGDRKGCVNGGHGVGVMRERKGGKREQRLIHWVQLVLRTRPPPVPAGKPA